MAGFCKVSMKIKKGRYAELAALYRKQIISALTDTETRSSL